MSRFSLVHHLPLMFLLALVDHPQQLLHHTNLSAPHRMVHALQHHQPHQSHQSHQVPQQQQQQAPQPQLPAFTPAHASNRTSQSDQSAQFVPVSARQQAASPAESASNQSAPTTANSQSQQAAAAAVAAATAPTAAALSAPPFRPSSFNPIGNLQREQPNYKTSTACEGNLMELACDEGKTIHLVRAIYGRFSLSICNEHGHSNYSVQCASFKSFLVLETRCNKLTSCNVTVSKDVFGDPCEGTAKYLEVQYNCLEAGGQGIISSSSSNNNNNSPVINNANTRQPTDAARTTAAPSGGHKSPAQQPHTHAGVGGGGVLGNRGGPFELPPRTLEAGGNNGAAPQLHQPQEGAATTTSGNNNLDNSDQRLPQQPTVILQQQQQQQQLFCAAQTSSRNLYWNSTRAGQVARQACPEGSSGRPVSWRCDFERLRFVPAWSPDFSQCRSNWLARLSQQLDAMLEAPAAAGRQSASARQQDEQMIRSILGELSLLAKTKELFSEDLKRIDIMISQMIAQLRSFSVLGGGGGPGPSALQVPSALRELFGELASICSSLFDAFQRNAWLELPTHEARARLELRLLGHLREAGAMLAHSLTPEQVAELAPLRQTNILASLRVLQGASPELLGLASNRLFEATGDADDATVRFVPAAAAAPVSAWQDDAEFRLPAPVVRALAANGYTKFLVLDVKKPDYSLMRLQLEQQQLQLQLAPYDQQPGETSQQNFGADQVQFQQRRLFGVFPVHAETGELLADGPTLAASSASLSPLPQGQQDSIRRQLAELTAQWPISIEFKSSQPAAGSSAPTRQCQSLSSDSLGQGAAGAGAALPSSGNRCHLFKYNASALVCACDKFGFVALAQQPLTGGSRTLATSVPQNDPSLPLWPPTSPYDPSLGLASEPQQPAAYDAGAPFVVNRQQQQQQQQQQQSLGAISYTFIVFGVALMVLSLGGLLVNVALRLRAHARLGKKQQQHGTQHQHHHHQSQGFFDSWRATGADGEPTTGPLAADHTLMGSDLLLGDAGTAHSASILGLATGPAHQQQQQHHHHHHHHQHLQQQQVLCGAAQPTYKAHQQQLYAGAHSPLPQGPALMEAYSARSRRAWPARLFGWLLERPARAHGWGWLSSGSAASATSNSSSADGGASAGKPGCGLIQHRVLSSATGSLAYQQQQQRPKGQPYNNQNGYTTSLGLHGHPHAQQHSLGQRIVGSAAGSQSGVPLNNSSNSSYVSSSAYYEEIGPGNLVTKVNAGQPNARLVPQQQQEFAAGQQQTLRHHWQHANYAAPPPPASGATTTFGQQQQQQAVSLITKQHMHNDLSPLQSSSSSSAGSQHSAAAAAGQANGTTPRHYLFASPIAVNAYKQQQQQFRGQHGQLDR